MGTGRSFRSLGFAIGLALALPGGAAGVGESTPKELAITSTGSTTARDLRDRFADVVNVKDFGARGDYVPARDAGTDDTAAFVAAVTLASATGGRIVIPPGRYLITDTITITKSVAITGAKRPGGPGAADEGRGSAIYFRNGDPSRPAFRVSASPAYAADGSYFADFELRNVSQPPNQHGIVFDTTSFSTLSMERITFWGMTGYAIFFRGNCYAQNLKFDSLSFFLVGGLWGREARTSTKGIDVTLAEVRNVNLDWGINPVSPQSPAINFQGWRELHISTMLLEGANANASAGGIGILLGGNQYAVLDGNHEEFSGTGFKNGIVIAETTYGGPPVGLYDLRNIHSVTPIRVTAPLAQVFLRGVARWGNPAIGISSIVDVAEGSRANVVIDGIQTAWLGNPAPPLKDIHRFSVRDVKTMYGTQNVSASYADTKEVFSWTARNGDPLLSRNGIVSLSVAPATLAGPGRLVTDAEAGRVWEFAGSPRAAPHLSIEVRPQPSYSGAQIIVAVRYKYETASTSGSPQVLTLGSEGGSPAISNPSAVGSWATSYAVIADYANDGLVTFYSRHVGVPTSNFTLRIAEIKVLLGRELPVLVGNVGAAERIDGLAASIPEAGAFIAGDRLSFPTVTPGGDVGAICIVGGSPGRWATLRIHDVAPGQRDSRASDVGALRDDFNSLLGRLRAAGILAP